jgi:hypothetical protein
MVAALLPLAIAATLVLSLPLPLQWWALAGSGAMTALLVVVTLVAARTYRSRVAGAATIALAIAMMFVLAYAAYALRRPGAFGPVSRLGYPFLVATGLRLQGGAWLVALCGLVALVPVVFRGRSG